MHSPGIDVGKAADAQTCSGMCADYYLGKDWVDLDDPSVTKDHVRKWRVLQDLKARHLGGDACHCEWRVADVSQLRCCASCRCRCHCRVYAVPEIPRAGFV